MKKCNQCGFITENDSMMFCTNCGKAFSNNANEGVPYNNSVPYDNNNIDYNSYGASVETDYMDISVDDSANTSNKSKNKKKKLLMICIPAIAVVLIAAIVVAIFAINWGGPVIEIVNAAFNTVEQESFTLEIDVDGDTAMVECEIDFTNHDIQMLFGTEEEFIFAVYDGKLIVKDWSYDYDYYYDDYEYIEYYRCEDISDEIQLFFDSYDQGKDILTTGDVDVEKILEIMENYSGEDSSELEESVEDLVDIEKTQDALKEFFSLLADEDWLEENLGFEEESEDGAKYYSYDLNFGKLANSIDDTFGNCFESNKVEMIFEDDFIEELEELDGRDYFVRGEIVIEDDYLKEFSVKVGRNGETYDRIKVEISDIGTTNIDEEFLQECLDECEYGY